MNKYPNNLGWRQEQVKVSRTEKGLGHCHQYLNLRLIGILQVDNEQYSLNNRSICNNSTYDYKFLNRRTLKSETEG